MKPRKKICFISLGIYRLFRAESPGAAPGGAEVQLRFLGEALGRSGAFDITFLSADFGQDAIEDFGQVKVARGPKPLFGQSLGKLLWRSAALFRALWSIDADLHVDRTASPRLALLALMRRFRGKPFVFMTACEEDCDGRYGSKNGRLFGMLYRYGLRRADRILVQTRRDGELLRRTYGLESTVFPNLFPAKPPAQTPKDVFLWVGRCSALKRPDLYLDLAQALPEERFVMIAPEAAVEEDLLSEVQRRAKDLPNVEMHGEIPFSEIQPWFDRAKVLVCTSTVEGFPNTFLQAAQGRTPILSLCVDPDGILERDQWGLCAGGDWRVFLNSAKRLSADSACRERLGEAAYRGLIENHDLAKNVQRFERIVADLLG